MPEEYKEFSIDYLRGSVAGLRHAEPNPPEDEGEAAYLAAYAVAFSSGFEPRSVYGSGGSARSSEGAGFVTPSSLASGGMDAGVDLYYDNNGRALVLPSTSLTLCAAERATTIWTIACTSLVVSAKSSHSQRRRLL